MINLEQQCKRVLKSLKKTALEKGKLNYKNNS